MNAIISGRNAIALLQDGDQLKSIHADALDTLVARKPADLPFLFGDGNDLQFFENVTSDEVATHLKRARNNDEALQLILILLDPELSKEVRQEAANVLEELLSTDEVAQHLLSVLYAQPLPDNADLAGALECCKLGSAKSAQNFFDALTNFQPIIREVRLAWDAIPDATFGAAELRVQYHAAVVCDGVFRDLVMTIAKGQDVDRFKVKSLQRPLVEILPELQLILQLWISPLKNKFKAPKAQVKQQKPNTRAQTDKEPKPSIDTKPSKIDSEWIASRQDAVRFYLSKRWNLRGDDLQGVLQETLTAALKSFTNYEDRNSVEPAPFLIGIAKNVAQSYFRRLNRHERRRAPIEIAECIGIVFNDETEAEELTQLLREKLLELPEKYVQVLELIFYQDYREREAAEKLGIPVDRLYSIKSDALKRLRKLCAKDKRFKTNLTSQNQKTLHDEQPLMKRAQSN